MTLEISKKQAEMLLEWAHTNPVERDEIIYPEFRPEKRRWMFWAVHGKFTSIL